MFQITKAMLKAVWTSLLATLAYNKLSKVRDLMCDCAMAKMDDEAYLLFIKLDTLQKQYTEAQKRNDDAEADLEKLQLKKKIKKFI